VYTDVVEVYDPATNTWSSLSPMSGARLGLAADSPGNGQIYVAGGIATGGCTDINERYNPELGMWESRAHMNVPRQGLVMVAPPASGSLFAIGGENSQTVSLLQDGTWTTSGTSLASAEVYLRDAGQISLQMTITPEQVEPGDFFLVKGLAKNVSDNVLNAVGAQVGPSAGGGLISLLSAPAGTLTLTPGESTTFIASYQAAAAGLVYLSFTTSGTDSSTGAGVAAYAHATSPFIIGYRAALQSSIGIEPLPMVPGSALTVTLTVSNTGGGTAYDGGAVMAVPVGSQLVTLVSGPSPSGTVTIGPGAVAAFTWTYSVVGAGYVVFSASGSWNDPVFGTVTILAIRSTEPSSPTGLAILPGTGQATLAWNPNPAQEQVAHYLVFRRTPDTILVLTGTTTGTRFVDSGLVNGQMYYYSLAAVNVDGAGALCAEVAAEPLMFPGRSGEIWISSSGLNPLVSNPVLGERVQVLINVPGCGPLGTAPCDDPMRVAVYTLLGEEVTVLFHGVPPPGEMLLEWDGRNNRGQTVASGGYLLGTDLPDGRRVVKKMAIVK
jgi:hypothetical protein